MVKVNPMYQILHDLEDKKISYSTARNKMRNLLKQDKQETNWAQVIPLVLSARSAVIYNLRDEGVDIDEIEERDFIDMIAEKIPLLRI